MERDDRGSKKGKSDYSKHSTRLSEVKRIESIKVDRAAFRDSNLQSQEQAILKKLEKKAEESEEIKVEPLFGVKNGKKKRAKAQKNADKDEFSDEDYDDM